MRSIWLKGYQVLQCLVAGSMISASCEHPARMLCLGVTEEPATWQAHRRVELRAVQKTAVPKTGLRLASVDDCNERLLREPG